MLFGFTYLHHPDQPLAHSSVSSYQRLYSPASNKVHSCTSSLSATFSSRYRPVDRGAQQLGPLTAFQIQQQAAQGHDFTRRLGKFASWRDLFCRFSHQTLKCWQTYCRCRLYRYILGYSFTYWYQSVLFCFFVNVKFTRKARWWQQKQHNQQTE